jgi:hypothetical protein
MASTMRSVTRNVRDHRRLRHRIADPPVPDRTARRDTGHGDIVLAYRLADRDLHPGNLSLRTSMG